MGRGGIFWRLPDLPRRRQNLAEGMADGINVHGVDRRAAAPAPDATTNGTMPNTNAIDVITIGLNLNRAASSAASATGMPCSIFWLANSTIKIAFFAANPIKVIKPI